jgi:hypothetical protein
MCTVRFEVLTAVSTKMTVFWAAAPCSLVEVYQRFRGPCCLHHQGDRYNLQDGHLNMCTVNVFSVCNEHIVY